MNDPAATLGSAGSPTTQRTWSTGRSSWRGRRAEVSPVRSVTGDGGEAMIEPSP